MVVGGILITLTYRKLTIAYDEDIGDQNSKPSTLPFPLYQPIIITYKTFWQPLAMLPLQNPFRNVKEKQSPAWLKRGS